MDAVEALGDMLTQCEIDGIDANGVRQRMELHMNAMRRYVTKEEHHSSSKSGCVNSLRLPIR